MPLRSKAVTREGQRERPAAFAKRARVSKAGRAKRTCRHYVAEGIKPGRRPELVGGGLIRSRELLGVGFCNNDRKRETTLVARLALARHTAGIAKYPRWPEEANVLPGFSILRSAKATDSTP